MLGQRSWVTCCSTVQCTYSICARTMQESPKLYSKRLNSHGRQNTLPIWVYYLSMSPTNSTNTDRSHHIHSTALEWPKIRWRCKIRNNDNNINITYCCVHCPWLKSPKCTQMKEAVFSIHFVNIDIDSFLLNNWGWCAGSGIESKLSIASRMFWTFSKSLLNHFIYSTVDEWFKQKNIQIKVLNYKSWQY